jgi:hypothetical protein
MASHNDLVIFQKVYDLTLWTYPMVNKFPKSQRFVLGQRIENLLIFELRTIIQANKERGLAREEHTRQISDALDELFVMIRLAKDLRFVSIRKYGIFSEKANEVGKLLHGWQQKLI